MTTLMGITAVIAIIIAFFTRSNRLNAIDLVLVQHIDLVIRGQYHKVWRSLSTELRATLENEDRTYLKKQGCSGLLYIQKFFSEQVNAYHRGSVIVQSRHLVQEAPSNIDMVMTHLRSSSHSKGLTIWLIKPSHERKGWRVHDIYVHSGTLTRPGKSLSGKRMATRKDRERHIRHI